MRHCIQELYLNRKAGTRRVGKMGNGLPRTTRENPVTIRISVFEEDSEHSNSGITLEQC